MQAKNDWRGQVRTSLYYPLVPRIRSSYVVSEVVSRESKLASTSAICLRAGQMCGELQRALAMGAADQGKGDERKNLRLHNPVRLRSLSCCNNKSRLPSASTGAINKLALKESARLALPVWC